MVHPTPKVAILSFLLLAVANATFDSYHHLILGPHARTFASRAAHGAPNTTHHNIGYVLNILDMRYFIFGDTPICQLHDERCTDLFLADETTSFLADETTFLLAIDALRREIDWKLRDMDAPTMTSNDVEYLFNVVHVVRCRSECTVQNFERMFGYRKIQPLGYRKIQPLWSLFNETAEFYEEVL